MTTKTTPHGRPLQPHDGVSAIRVCGQCGVAICDRDAATCPNCGSPDTAWQYAEPYTTGREYGDYVVSRDGRVTRVSDGTSDHYLFWAEAWGKWVIVSDDEVTLVDRIAAVTANDPDDEIDNTPIENAALACDLGVKDGLWIVDTDDLPLPNAWVIFATA